MMSDFIDDVSQSDNAWIVRVLPMIFVDQDDFEVVFGDDVSVSNCQKSGAGEVNAIQVFGLTVGIRLA